MSNKSGTSAYITKRNMEFVKDTKLVNTLLDLIILDAHQNGIESLGEYLTSISTIKARNVIRYEQSLNKNDLYKLNNQDQVNKNENNDKKQNQSIICKEKETKNTKEEKEEKKNTKISQFDINNDTEEDDDSPDTNVVKNFIEAITPKNK